MHFLPLRALVVCVLLALALPLQAQQPDPIVRVYVLSRVAPQSLTVRATTGPLSVYANRENTPLHTLMPGESVTLDRVGDRVRITTPTGAMQASVGEVVPTNGAPLSLRTGSHSRTYHGAVSVEIDNDRRALRLVNYVPVERYVASVVASEYPFSEIEGVKAQAVLARTYALRAHGRYASYDLYDDTRSQVYQGEEKVTSITLEATEATRGQVLTYRGELVEALYYSSSGGHTANNEAIWNTNPVPYLRGVPDPYDSAAPDHRWSTSASASDLLRALGRRYGGTVTGFEIAGRTPSGRVRNVQLQGSRSRTITASQFRSVVTSTFGARTLRSTHFSVERRGNRYVFSGRGFGHGVGMSQFGARGQALQGRTYRDILSFYFSGTSIDLRDSAFLDPPNVAYNAPPRRTRPTRRSEAFTASPAVPSNTPAPYQTTRPDPVAVSSGSDPTWSNYSESSTPARRTAW